jgi:hypothetical protein
VGNRVENRVEVDTPGVSDIVGKKLPLADKAPLPGIGRPPGALGEGSTFIIQEEFGIVNRMT